MKRFRVALSVVVILTTTALVLMFATANAPEAASGKCGAGIQSCSASRVGQPCNPHDLNVICTAQSNGSYCCLASAP